MKSRKKSAIISCVLCSRKQPTPKTSSQSDSGEVGKEPSGDPRGLSGEMPKFSMGLGVGETIASGFSLYPDGTLGTVKDKSFGLNIVTRFLFPHLIKNKNARK